MTDSLAYAAGFLDGEGCVGVYRDSHRNDRQGRPRVRQSGYHSASLQASGYGRAPLDLLVDLFGGRVATGRSLTGHVLHHWRINAQEQVEAVLRQLLPYLLVKREQAELTIQFLVWRRSVKRTSGPRSGRSFDPWEVAEAGSFAEALKVIKKD